MRVWQARVEDTAHIHYQLLCCVWKAELRLDIKAEVGLL